MTAPATLPYPRSNQSEAGRMSRASELAAADIIVAAGDYTGGTAEDQFTLSGHGLVDGDVLHVLWQSAMGGVTGGDLTRGVVLVTSSSVFQLTTDGSTIIENTADATVVFVKGRIPTSVVADTIYPFIIVGTHDYTGGAAEDIDTPAQGAKGVQGSDSIKLLYKSAAGTAGVAADATAYVKTPTVTYFQHSATAGGSVLDTTADGTNVWLKTS